MRTEPPGVPVVDRWALYALRQCRAGDTGRAIDALERVLAALLLPAEMAEDALAPDQCHGCGETGRVEGHTCCQPCLDAGIDLPELDDDSVDLDGIYSDDDSGVDLAALDALDRLAGLDVE